MKKIILLLVQSLFVITTYGQNLELSLQLNSGLFAFGGPSAAMRSIIIVSESTSANYTNNPYGNKKSFSYGASLQIQKISLSNNIVGFQLGYETLRSKIEIDKIGGSEVGYFIPASGQTIFKNDFIWSSLNLGHRFSSQDLSIVLTVGPEVGYLLTSKEKGEVTVDDGRIVKTNLERINPEFDFRIGSSISGYFKKIGLSMGYSYGVTNYTKDMIGNKKTFSRLLRLSLIYKIIKA